VPRPYDGAVHPECDPCPVGVRRCLTCRPGGSAKSSLASDATALSRSTAIARRRWSAALRRGRRCTAPSLPSPWPSQVRPSAKTMCGKGLPFRRGQAVSDPPVRQPGTSQRSAMATALRRWSTREVIVARIGRVGPAITPRRPGLHVLESPKLRPSASTVSRSWRSQRRRASSRRRGQGCPSARMSILRPGYGAGQVRHNAPSIGGRRCLPPIRRASDARRGRPLPGARVLGLLALGCAPSMQAHPPIRGALPRH
jgi:hypothetical protein